MDRGRARSTSRMGGSMGPSSTASASSAASSSTASTGASATPSRSGAKEFKFLLSGDIHLPLIVAVADLVHSSVSDGDGDDKPMLTPRGASAASPLSPIRERTLKRSRAGAEERQQEQEEQDPVMVTCSVYAPGIHRARLHPGLVAHPLHTPAFEGVDEELARLDAIQQRFEEHAFPRVQWQDTIALRKLERMQQRRVQAGVGSYVLVRIPRLPHPVFFSEGEVEAPQVQAAGGGTAASSSSRPSVPQPPSHSLPPRRVKKAPSKPSLKGAAHGLAGRGGGGGGAGSGRVMGRGADASPTSYGAPEFPLISIRDPELWHDNPVEAKYLALTQKIDIDDPSLKPNLSEARKLSAIVKLPPTAPLSAQDLALLWKFRHHLSTDPEALVKFVRCVQWQNYKVAPQAEELLLKWAPLSGARALELLSPDFSSHAMVRHYAVGALQHVPDHELKMYLFSLVQGLRYESDHDSCLGDFLIARALESTVLANYLYWYLVVECEDQEYGAMYKKKLSAYSLALSRSKGGKATIAMFNRQKKFVGKLKAISESIVGMSSTWTDNEKRVARLRQMLTKDAEYFQGPLPLPLDPEVIITGIVVEKCSVMTSSTLPLKLVFRTESGLYKMMFKFGDDVRQDTFILQMVSLIHYQMKKESFDLRLTPYNVLAATRKHGMIEWVEAVPLTAVSSISSFLEQHVQEDGPSTIDNFLRSCAGYCVITYIFGVGDRHHDNLMLRQNGQFLHIDFGFCFGRDPKPFPPPFKLSPSMVEGMGGTSSEHYVRFKEYCCEAYNRIRSHANLILDLVTLILGANLESIDQSDKTVKKVLENFCLDLTDEEAARVFMSLINKSASALFAQVTDRLHDWKQYWIR